MPIAIHGSSRVRNWKRLQFPKVTVLYGDPIRWERVEDPTREQQQQVANAIFAEVRKLYTHLDVGRPERRRPAAARAASGVTEVLRPGVLEGVRVRVVGAGPLGDAVAARLSALGASHDQPADALIVDAAAMFASAAGVDAVRARARRSVGGDPAGGEPGRSSSCCSRRRPATPTPRPRAPGSRTSRGRLSIEWARLGIRPVAIHPGTATPAGDVAELAAFLASPAGAYYSGCRFDLR